MKSILSFLILTLLAFSANAQPKSFGYKMQVDVDLSHSIGSGSAECLKSAKVLIPNARLLAKFADNLSCSAVEPQVGGGSNNAMCVTMDVSDSNQYVMAGEFALDSGSFWLGKRDYMKLSDDSQSHIWLRVVFGKQNDALGSFEIRGIDKNEWILSQLANKKLIDVQTDCRLILPTHNSL